MTVLKGGFRDLQRNYQALKQTNLTVIQLPYIIKEFGVWWNLTKNLREIEGSWAKTLKANIHFFKGVPRKRIYQPFDTVLKKLKTDDQEQ